MSSWVRTSTKTLSVVALSLTAVPTHGAESRGSKAAVADRGPIRDAPDLAQVSMSVEREGVVVAEPTIFTPIGTTRLIDEAFLAADGFEHARMAFQIQPEHGASGRYRGVFFYDVENAPSGRFVERLVKGVTKTVRHDVAGIHWEFVIHVHDGLAP